LLVVVAAVAALALPACASPRLDVASCQATSKSTVRALAANLTVAGSLRHAYQLSEPSSGYTMVSAELHLSSDKLTKKGHILTFAARGRPVRFVAVDGNARRDTRLPPASFDVRARGAILSRACTNRHLGSAA
jgi:hypothetical protein